ncbi:hypothetical protein QUB36_28650 [Microcoleus sp. AT8-B1]|uniref:hypothetical protein n=1 Tax=unclassified Microcoleus TaxID=2642155 RepID=UPI002FD32E9D
MLKNKIFKAQLVISDRSNIIGRSPILVMRELTPLARYRSGSNQYGSKTFPVWEKKYISTSSGNLYAAGFWLNSTIPQEVCDTD